MSLLRCVVAPHRRLFCGFAGAVLLCWVAGKVAASVTRSTHHHHLSPSSSSCSSPFSFKIFSSCTPFATHTHPPSYAISVLLSSLPTQSYILFYPSRSVSSEGYRGGVVVEQRVKIKLRQAERRLLWLWYGGWAALKAFARLLQRYAGTPGWRWCGWVDGVAAAPDHDCVFCYVQVRVNSPIHIFCECGISSSTCPNNNSNATYCNRHSLPWLVE